MLGEAIEVIKGTIENVVFYSAETDYAVLEISSDTGLLITAVGAMPIPAEGESVVLTGRWKYHKEFGKQLAFDSFEKRLPEGTDEILQYLSSHTVEGVGPVTAKKLVDRFGKDTFDVIENHPEWLADIPGITMKKAAKISESFREQNGLRGVVMFCKDYMGITAAAKVYKKLGSGAVGIITENPYILCENEYGIPFANADELAMSLGFTKDNRYRLLSGIKYVLAHNANMNGHTCLPKEKLISAVAITLEVEERTVEESLLEFLEFGDLSYYSQDGNLFVMINEIAEAENYIAKRISEIDNSAVRFGTADIEGLINKVESTQGIIYAALQRKAIYEALLGGVMVLTGGPGTGKTTIVKALLSIFSSLGMKAALTAPTGRAAKRMSEATSAEAKTIHRMLEMEKGSDLEIRFGRNAGNPLDENVVIVDEASMIDTLLMEALMRAMRRGSRLILIGDANQLPSVGAGNVLSDLIESDRIRTVALTEIFRQSSESLIITNAHKINNGENPYLGSVDGDFFFVGRDREWEIPKTISDLVTSRLPKRYGSTVIDKIQIITPTRKGTGGVEALNTELQSVMNPPSKRKAEKTAHSTLFREGDKVMQISNNYEIEWTRGNESGMGIFNGDIGVIEKINLNDGNMLISFDEKSVEYSFDLLDELELAYAITVHKSQGSEYPVVIIPMYHCPPMLMTRNLLYTAVTRAKQMVIMVGKADICRKMVENNSEILRYTTLKMRIVDYN